MAPPCFLCRERGKLEAELARLEKWRRNPVERPPVDAAFRSRVICHVTTPHGRNPLDVATCESLYKQDHANWDTGLVRMPPGPLYFDKMALTQRARDLEKQPQMSSQEKGNYVNRIGAMAEATATETLARVLQGRPAVLVQGFKFRDYLHGVKKTRKDTKPCATTLGVPVLEDAGGKTTRLGGTEHDAMAVVPNHDQVDVVFGQVKAVVTATEDKLKDVISKAWKQLSKDVEGFLLVLPEVDAQTATRVNFHTLAILPSTRQVPSICAACCAFIVFREELTPGAVDQGSWAEDLVHDLRAQAAIPTHTDLCNKAGLNTIRAPTMEGLELFLTISARYVGTSSLFPMKDYPTFIGKLMAQLRRIDTQVVTRSLERAVDTSSGCEALHLTPQQVAAVHSGRVMLTGMFGSGKTTVTILLLPFLLLTHLSRCSSASGTRSWRTPPPPRSTWSAGTTAGTCRTGSRTPSPTAPTSG